MTSELFLSLAATAFAAMLFYFSLKRRSREIIGGEANNDAAAKDGIAGGAASARTMAESHGMATTSGYDFEVFLSFRGPDTRATFTDYLYTSLKNAGIRTFKDDEELRVGEEFAPKLLQAINQSEILIPIFSKGYASSIWCLKELVQMVECQKTREHKIMPIFYDVTPSEVRFQTGCYGRAFLSYESKKRYDEETMRRWKDALSFVGALNGWDLHSKLDRREGEFAKTVTQKIFNELKKAYLEVSNCLVSVDNHVDAIMEMIGYETSETRIIGIHGMGGIGKTTIAKVIYNQLSKKFEGCCFLSNVREKSKLKGIQCLQHQLISDILNMNWIDIRDIDEGIKTIKDRLSNKRVLLIVDDVEETDHMSALVGNHDWFGKGSKIVITTRNKEVLKITKVGNLYEVNGMDHDRSLQLFSKHAFRRDSPLDEYIHQSNKAIGIAGGLPLALEVIGSLLSCIEKKKWDGTLEKLAKVPHVNVQNKLKISYDALEVRQQHIFLDIACFFIGYDKNIVVHLWEKSKFFPEEAMGVLQNMSLIKIEEDNRLWMHDQLRDLGREMIRQESKMKIEKQSRVWNPMEALDLLRRHEGKTKVEALCLEFDHEWQYRFTCKDFKRLSSLRFLEVNGLEENFHAEDTLLWHESPSNVLPTNGFQENSSSDLLPQLRWLAWPHIPPTFKITNFSMENVVILDLSKSEITDDWKGWRHIKVMKKLKVLDLSKCESLKRTPNFSADSNLERLILWGCKSLIKIDRSICQLKRLVFLDLSFCENLWRLPDELGGDLTSLEYLSLKYCTSLERLPITIGNMESLIELNISNTRIEELPDSIGKLKKLKVVKMADSKIRKIPDAFWMIEKLEKIEASGGVCGDSLHGKIDNCIYRNKSLRILKLRWMDIHALPRLPESLIKLQLSQLYMDMFPDLSNLANLKELDLSFASRHSDVPAQEYDDEEEEEDEDEDDVVKSNGLGEYPIPQWIGNLSKLESLDLRSPYVTTSPTDLSLPPQLKSLRLDCPNLRRLPMLPSSLSSLCLERGESLCSVDISNLKKLSSLYIWHAAITEIQGLGCLENLRDLRLGKLEQVKILPDLSNLNKLTSLNVEFCYKLVEIQGELPQSLEELVIYDCESLQKLPDLSSLEKLKQVHIEGCRKLTGEAIVGYAWRSQANLWENLQDLRLQKLEQVETLPDLSNLNKLKSLQLGHCDKLVEIQGELPQSLEELKISYCNSLQKLPDLSSLKKLKQVDIEGCRKLKGEAILGYARRSQASMWENLRYLRICCLGQVEILPDLTNLNKLRSLLVRRCINLVEIQGELPQSLEELEIDSCNSLQKLPDLSNLKEVRKVNIAHCWKLKAEAIVGSAWRSQANMWENMRYLRICGLGQVEILPDLSNLNKLRSLLVQNCENLVEIQGELPQSLKELVIDSCKSLLKFPDLSNLMGKQEVNIYYWNHGKEIFARKTSRDLELIGFEQLQILPDLSYSNGLRRLLARNCGNLVEIQGELPHSLEELVISCCESLQKLPDLSSLRELQKVVIEGCVKLNVEAIFGFVRRGQANLWENLQYLWIGGLGQVEILPDLSNLNKLRSLKVRYCDFLIEIQGELPQSVEELEIDSCKSLQKLPNLSSLKELQKVDIARCWKLKGEAILGSARRRQANLRENLQYLRICGLEQVEILPDLSNLYKLRSLLVENCDNLIEIQGELPQSLEELEIDSCKSLQKLPDLSSLLGRREVNIHYANCSEGIIARKISGELVLTGLEQLQILPDLSCLNKLRRLEAISCGNLVEIQGKLPQSLEELEINSCESLQKLPDLSSSVGLRVVSICDCRNLVGIQGKLPQSLEELDIDSCESLQKLPDLSSSMGLRVVAICDCRNLVQIQGELPQSLEKLKISFCESLQELPDLSSIKGLQKVEINHCWKLNVKAISSFCSEKSVKFVGEEDGSKSEEEDDESESEPEEEDDEFESEPEGEEDEAELKSKGEVEESEHESGGEDEE